MMNIQIQNFPQVSNENSENEHDNISNNMCASHSRFENTLTCDGTRDTHGN